MKNEFKLTLRAAAQLNKGAPRLLKAAKALVDLLPKRGESIRPLSAIDMVGLFDEAETLRKAIEMAEGKET